MFATTSDEPAHIATGMEYVAKHAYTLESQHPPLTRAMFALLPYFNGTRPRNMPDMQHEGWALLTYEHHAEQTLFLARLGNLPFFILGGLVVFFWGRRYCSPAAGALAVLLYTMIPSVLAHAGLATTDMGLSACLGAAFLSAVIWAEKPTHRNAIRFGICSALAVLAKFSTLVFYPAALLLALLFYVAIERPAPGRLVSLAKERAASFAVAVALGMFLVWAAYLFSWGKVAGWHSNISVPAPQFFDGIQVVRTHNAGGHPAYLLRQARSFGWWYYFPVALSVKTPLALLAMVAIGLLLSWINRRRLACSLPVAFALGILLPSMAAHINIGVRHVLPIYLAFAVLAALALEHLIARSEWQKWAGAIAGVLILWLTLTGALHHPDYIAYFNELVRNPDQVLLDSDYDWGQDTKRLAARLRQLGARSVNYGYVGATDHAFLEAFPGLPPITSIHPAYPAEGWTAVCPTMHRVTQYGLEYRYPNMRPWFEYLQPREQIGTIRLYYLPPGSVAKRP